MNSAASAATSEILAPQDAQTILALRLLIARAAQNDSLAWWDDSSLTAPARFMLYRLFPMVPPVAGRSLAIRAASRRHTDACEAIPRAVHLYRLDLDNRDRLALRYVLPIHTPVPEKPIRDMAQLRQHLLALLRDPMPYTVVHRSENLLQINVPPPPPATSLLLHRAQTLAWAYLEGAPGHPVFPFCLENSP